MAEQIPLNFNAPTELERLLSEYKKKVGVAARTNDLAELREALLDPEKEQARLAKIDSDEDKEELARPYRGR